MFPSQNIADLTVVRDFPNTIRHVENIWIPLSDGTRLAGRMWLPADADRQPVPAVLEYIPYRKRDGTVADDERMHPWFAGHGYASLRIDLRGSGDSQGLLEDEYLPGEQDDALEVLDWLSNQAWCDGCIGMIGISWGGFAALQVAARRPPMLKAIVTVGSTVDRYMDDIHYKGGCLLLENAGWAATMLSFGSRPPDPAVVGDSWRDIWLQRLEHQPYLVEQWIAHQHRDAYWKHGSVCENYDAIEAAVLAVGGWADAYMNAVPRLIENLKAPCRGIVGPWPHRYPHLAAPGPAIGFLQECVRWWDHWLKGQDTGVMREPLYRLFCQTGARPDPLATSRPGRWISEESWPSPNISDLRLSLNANGLGQRMETAIVRQFRSPQDTGQAGGELVPHCPGPEMAHDQRIDDGRSMVFDTLPLETACDIVGAPEVHLRLSIDRPQGNLIVRLCHVAQDGASERVTFGTHNLCHRGGSAAPRPVVPGETIDAVVALNQTAFRIPEGSRIRLTVSTACWPLVWPSPEAVTLSLHYGDSWLILPVRSEAGQSAPVFAPPASPPPARLREIRSSDNQRRVVKDLATGVSTIEIVDDYGEVENLDHGLINGAVAHEHFSIHEDDPQSARTSKCWTQILRRGDWSVRTETASEMWCDRTAFHFEASVKAYEGEMLCFEREWRRTIPRRHV